MTDKQISRTPRIGASIVRDNMTGCWSTADRDVHCWGPLCPWLIVGGLASRLWIMHGLWTANGSIGQYFTQNRFSTGLVVDCTFSSFGSSLTTLLWCRFSVVGCHSHIICQPFFDNPLTMDQKSWTNLSSVKYQYSTFCMFASRISTLSTIMDRLVDCRFPVNRSEG